MRHIIPISGKDSLCTAIVQIARKPDLNYEFIFNDIGTELPETYAWLDLVEKTLNIKIQRIGKSLIDEMYHAGFLPSSQKRYCTRLTKIEPMEKFIDKTESTIYFGLRSDESERSGFQTKNKFIKIEYPLRELNIDLQMVYVILEKQNLLPPTFFWKSVYDLVIEKMDVNIIDKLPRYVFNMLFAGRSRTNCYFCFNQRRYEWIWLYESHPDLFERAWEYEQELGSSEFTWVEGKPLNSFISDISKYKELRAKDIIKQINKYLQLNLLENNDLMGLTSCGLMCGK